MASIKVILNLKKVNKKDEAPLYLRIIKNRKPKYLSLGIYLTEKQWDPDKQRVRKAHPNSGRINALIAQRIADAEGVTVDMETKSKTVTSRKIKEQILGAEPVEFIPYVENYLPSLEAAGKINSHKRVKSVINKLKEYLEKKHLKKLYFDDITVSFLKEYESYLISDLNNHPNTVHSNFRVIRKFINDAIREDKFSRNDNPFYKYALKLEKTTKEYLTEEELKKIENLVLPEDKVITIHRDIYVFAVYAGGLRISDVLTLKWENFDGERINLQIQKTKTTHTVKLPDKAIEIIKQYAPKKSKKPNSTDFIFPLLDKDLDYSNPRTLISAISSATAYTNKDLKAIEKKIKLKKHLSFHTSRHTFATWALRKGIRIEYVSKLLGHANIKETQVYAKIVNAELEKAMDVFND